MRLSIRSILSKNFTGEGVSIYVLALGCLLLAPWNDAAIDSFGLVRGAVREGEFWRLLTGHLVHSSWLHLALNLAALVVLQQLFGRELRWVVWLWGYAVIAITIGVCFLAFSRYGSVVGLSGMLHGLYVYVACLALRRDALLAAGVLVLLAAKVIWEQIAGASSMLEQWIGMAVAIDAHLYGLLSGAVLGAVMAAVARRGYSD
jgi:rhomboid family GlyGly-CTERM serine protease